MTDILHEWVLGRSKVAEERLEKLSQEYQMTLIAFERSMPFLKALGSDN